MKLLYFAWVRERIGAASEDRDTSAATVRDLVAELCAEDPRYAAAFADMSVVRVALDQELGDLDDPIADASEIAFFPPMTGG